MPDFATLDGSTPSIGIKGDQITFTHVNELRIWNYIDSLGEEQQDLWLKIGEDFDGLDFVHLKCSGVRDLQVGTVQVLEGLTLVSDASGAMELKAGDDFRVRCQWVSFVD